jgi:hypothetical protein
MELLLARNPDPDSSLPYLLRLPLGDGLVYRTKGTWPRTSALFCFPVPLSEWPTDPELVERLPLRSCVRRGAAIDIIADRPREHRSQIVHTRARGRDVVFWQSPKTRKQSRPTARVPTARASGIVELEILVDVHERYPYTFAGQQVRTTRRPLRCGDYAIEVDGALIASVERKSVADFSTSLTSGRLRFAVAELASLPRAALVVEERYSSLFQQDFVRASVLTDGLAELQIRYPRVPVAFCDNRKLAQEWTYRYLAAARAWVSDDVDPAVAEQEPAGQGPTAAVRNEHVGEVTPAELRAWALSQGHTVSDRGRIPAEIRSAWHAVHGQPPSAGDEQGR